MARAVLALNAGSSSLKVALAPAHSPETPALSGAVDRLGGPEGGMTITRADGTTLHHALADADHDTALRALCDTMAAERPDLRIAAIGHRIVHGGADHTDPVRATPEVIAALDALTPLAPLHQPHGVQGIRTALSLFPDAAHVACFDTAFHATKPWVQDTFALPGRYFEMGLRRFGFHGLACQSVCAALRAEGYALDARAVVIAHLGNGCSVTAVQGGRSVATSMGFSALDGLAMGTRCGRIDPGAILHLLRLGYDRADLEDLLYRQSGLLGLSGLSNDMRDLTRSDAPEARRAVEFFVTRAAEEICRLAGAMGGLDSVVFSGGIGENAPEIRDAITSRLAFLPGRDGQGVESLVRPAREEQELMRIAAGFL